MPKFLTVNDIVGIMEQPCKYEYPVHLRQLSLCSGTESTVKRRQADLLEIPLEVCL